jgi:hypothetical protein
LPQRKGQWAAEPSEQEEAVAELGLGREQGREQEQEREEMAPKVQADLVVAVAAEDWEPGTGPVAEGVGQALGARASEAKETRVAEQGL